MTAWRSWMPANGSEGDAFESTFCATCTRGDGCEVFLRALCGEQPDEWQQRPGEVRCTARVPVEGGAA